MVITLLPTIAFAGTATTVVIGGVTLDSSKPYLVNGAATNVGGTLGENGFTAFFNKSI